MQTRAALVDEGLDILNGLWSGQAFQYSGTHYQIQETSFLRPPPPIQQPRIPIWVVAAWPRPKSMQRALRCDGLLPTIKPKGEAHRPPTPADIREMKVFIAENRTLDTPFDIVVEGENTPGDDPDRASEIVKPWADAGATWWIESRWFGLEDDRDLGPVRERIVQGPPRIR